MLGYWRKNDLLLRKFFDLRSYDLIAVLKGLETAMNNSYVACAFASNAQYYNNLTKLLDNPGTIEVSVLVLHCFRYLFASKAIKNSSRVFAAIENCLYNAYSSPEDIPDYENSVKTIITNLLCIMFSTTDLANAPPEIKNAESIPIVFRVLHRLGTPELQKLFLNKLWKRAEPNIKNRIKLVEKDAAIYLLQYFGGPATVLSTLAMEFAISLLQTHSRRKDVLAYFDKIRGDSANSKSTLKVIYKAIKATWAPYNKKYVAPPQAIFSFGINSRLLAKKRIPLQRGLTIFTWIKP